MAGMPPTFLRRFRWPLAFAGLVLGVAVVAPFVYIQFIKADAAERPTLDDVITTTTAGGGTTSTTAAGAAEGIDGTWTTTGGSVVQYRVIEVLFGQDAEATGTADGVTGTVEIAGTTATAVEVEVDMTSFESDESRRDSQFQGRIMETAEFPTATFALTEPLELGSIPADGERITVEATGELTMHGVTNTVTFDLTAALNGTTFAAEAAIPITFTDYGIDDPSGGPASVGNDGTLEILLVFGR
jgi:polyisoprenoid-binding protein YceI